MRWAQCSWPDRDIAQDDQADPILRTPTQSKPSSPVALPVVLQRYVSPRSLARAMSVTVVLGSQWGDEGKGKLVDILSAQADICARCAGGNNAGHTIVVNMPGRGKTTFAFHILPSGLVNPTCTGLIGNGCVVHLPSFFEELDALEAQGLDCTGRLFISDRAQLVFDFHQIVDGLKEVELGGSSIGTTKKGIGPAYSGKASRSGLRIHHLFNPTIFADKFRKVVEGRFKRYGHFEYDTEGEIERYKALAERLRPYVIDSVAYVHSALASGKRVLVEGANALMLDLDFGTYPYVTSSSTTIGGVCTGLGIPPKLIGKTIGVMKAYTTRVGGGPFPTEQLNTTGEHLQEVGREWGVTTGRRRRCGWLDLVVMKHSCLINGYDALNLTKLDVLDDLAEIQVATKYLLDGKELPGFPADLDVLARVEVQYVALPGWQASIADTTEYAALPENCRAYIEYAERFLGVPIEWIGVGPGRESMIQKPLKQ
ncbi:Adenylosuccinate synthetase [Punctularia strigosozonata HHB-11173 SS5]|uniref:Adenylosuccinate synthetase n=1 Tax=Punctularia strigosozonata (strain HHB-11173) TaxID=741275 RepID=UPI0004416DEA|nr:Adenylosuccinate synthetase [Punctularia strigosozonata HHB-11173 SS5]EIN06980.1 Adenylosuccinate synthetase [Punctularia strigosozonata HHB-11173 SS5]